MLAEGKEGGKKELEELISQLVAPRRGGGGGRARGCPPYVRPGVARAHRDLSYCLYRSTELAVNLFTGEGSTPLERFNLSVVSVMRRLIPPRRYCP